MHTCDEAWTALDHGFKTFMDCLGKLTEEELHVDPGGRQMDRQGHGRPHLVVG